MISKLIYLYYIKQKANYPSFPEAYIPPPKYSDKTANGLTKCIIDFLNFSGHRADRISSAGRYIDSSKDVKDVLGNTRKIGTGTWIKSETRNGYSDVNATIRGRSVMIEIKIKDKMSIHQSRFAEAERAAGGQYWLCHSFDEFFFQYETFLDYIK